MIGDVIHVLDVLILLALGAAVIIGFRTGAVRQVVGFLGVIFSLVAAFVLMHPAGALIVDALNVRASVGPLLGFVAVYVTAQLTIAVTIRVAEGVIGILYLSAVNRMLGSVVGFGKVLIVLSILFVALQSFDVPDRQARLQSVLYEPVVAVVPSAWNYVSSEVVDADELAAMFRERLGRQFAHSGQ